MSKQTRQFDEQLKNGEQPTLVEAIKEAASSMKEIGGQIWDGMKPMVDHGRSEFTALLYTGNAHVMYMKGQDNEQSQVQGQTNELPEQQREVGREM